MERLLDFSILNFKILFERLHDSFCRKVLLFHESFFFRGGEAA